VAGFLGMAVQEKGSLRAAFDLEELGRRASDIRPLSYKVRTAFRQAEEARFDRQGPGWPPLADSTKERKARQGLDPRVMRAKQVLYRSLTSPRAALQVDRREQHEMEFGTQVPYAHFHQTGTGVPRRPLVELTVAQHQALTEAMAEYVSKGQT